MRKNTPTRFQWRIIIFILVLGTNTCFGQTGCLYSNHFDKNGPKTIVGGWNNYGTEVKDSKLRITLDGTQGHQWYNWSVDYIGNQGTASPMNFSIPGYKPVIRFRARASDTVTVSVALVDKKGVISGGTETSARGIIDLTTEYRNFEIDLSGLFFNEWNNNIKLDSTAISGITFIANPGYQDHPFINTFGQFVDKAFNGHIEFDWVGTGTDCHLPENYLNFSIPDRICKDSIITLHNLSGNFVNDPQVVLNPGQDGEIIASEGNKYLLRYTSLGNKTIELSFNEAGTTHSYTEVIKVKDCTPGHFTQKVVGYVPSYRDASTTDYTLLTHAMFAFLEVKADGSIAAFAESEQKNFEKFLAATGKANTKKFISLRGSDTPPPGWVGVEEIAKSPAAIHHFADTLIKFCLYHGLDGADMDWEGLSTEEERDRYTQLMDTLERHLHATGLQLTATLPYTAAWGQWFADAALQKADWLQIMAYDAAGNFPQSPFGNHSPFQTVTSAETYWTGRGYEREKLVIGVPFYGYKFKSTAGGMATPTIYRDIVANFPMMTDDMDQTPGNDLTLFNGPALVRQKCKYLKEKEFGGVMAWEVTQDAPGHKSLLRHMICALKDDVGCTEFKPCETGDITTGIVGQWDFDGNSNDKSGNGNHASIDAGKLAYDRYGNPDNALISDNKALLVNCGNDESLQLDDLTISAWVNPSRQEDGKVMTIVRKQEGCSPSYALSLEWNQVTAELNAENKKHFLFTPTQLTPGNWYHIVLTHSYEHGSKIYINGLLDQLDTSKFHVIKKVPGALCEETNLEFGHSGNMSYDGKLDDIRIYNKELSQCDIDGLFYSSYSNDNPTTGIIDIEELSGLKIYPNPSNGNYKVELPGHETGESIMTITNTTGQKVGEYILRNPVTEIQQKNDDGIYFIKISSEKQQYSQKIIIQNTVE